jgi:hypothetical protein
LSGRIAEIEQTLKGAGNAMQRCDELMRELEKERSEKNVLGREMGRLKLLEEQRCAREATMAANPRQGLASGANMAPRQAVTSSTSEAPRERRRTSVTCYRCNGVGHYARDCQAGAGRATVSSKNVGTNDEVEKPEQVCGTEFDASAREAYIRLEILGKVTDCLLDTGSDVTLLPAKLVGTLPVEPSDQKLLAANGTAIKVVGKISLTARGGQHTFAVTGFVSDQVADVILGIDFLKAQRALWCFWRAEIILDGHKHTLQQRKRAGWLRRIVAAQPVTVPGRAECVIPAFVLFHGTPGPFKGDTGGWITEQAEPFQGLYVSRIMIPDRSLDLPVRVLNISKTDVDVPAGTVLANLEPVTEISVPEDSVSESALAETRSRLINDLVERVDEAVPEEIRLRLKALLENYNPVFSAGDYDLGRTNVAQHEIDTNGARPIRQALRRHPPAHAVAIQEHVSVMLKQGIIEPAQSPWASNVVLVRKKDGTLRCCIDYRQLNRVTRKDAYPLPRIDVCLDAMSGAQWSSTFDFRCSYHQVEVRPEDADKTAFICREGLFKFTIMPFGLTGAPATFQRLMDMIMSGLTYEICLVYLDDIIVFSTTMEGHLERLSLVLDRIRSSGLKIKANKTHLLKRSVDFLGHVVSYRGIEPQAEKIIAVQIGLDRKIFEMSRPSSVCVPTIVVLWKVLRIWRRRFMTSYGRVRSSNGRNLARSHLSG